MTAQVILTCFSTGFIVLAVIFVVRSTAKVNKTTAKVRKLIEDLTGRVERLEQMKRMDNP